MDREFQVDVISSSSVNMGSPTGSLNANWRELMVKIPDSHPRKKSLSQGRR